MIFVKCVGRKSSTELLFANVNAVARSSASESNWEARNEDTELLTALPWVNCNTGFPSTQGEQTYQVSVRIGRLAEPEVGKSFFLQNQFISAPNNGSVRDWILERSFIDRAQTDYLGPERATPGHAGKPRGYWKGNTNDWNIVLRDCSRLPRGTSSTFQTWNPHLKSE